MSARDTLTSSLRCREEVLEVADVRRGACVFEEMRDTKEAPVEFGPEGVHDVIARKGVPCPGESRVREARLVEVQVPAKQLLPFGAIRRRELGDRDLRHDPGSQSLA